MSEVDELIDGAGRFLAAMADIRRERARQITDLAYSPARDDSLDFAELARAAASYALAAAAMVIPSDNPHHRITVHRVRETWPFPVPPNLIGKAPRRLMVIAGALILAEIERLDRAEARAARVAPAE